MVHLPPDKQHKLVLLLSIGVALLSLVTVFGFVGLQAYIRWSVNQDFTFLGGSALEVLIVSTFALLIALLYVSRSGRRE